MIKGSAQEVTVLHKVIPAGDARLGADLSIPAGAARVVIFAHGSGSSRLSPRNRHVAALMQERGLATLLLDLLTAEEEQIDSATAEYRFHIRLLAGRLSEAAEWLRGEWEAEGREGPLRLGYFGASTGAAAALVSAAERPGDVGAVVSRGGRPDMAASVLPGVKAPTLLIVGELDRQVLKLNRDAWQLLRAQKELVVIPGATHLFEEPGALEAVAAHAADWFEMHLG